VYVGRISQKVVGGFWKVTEITSVLLTRPEDIRPRPRPRLNNTEITFPLKVCSAHA